MKILHVVGARPNFMKVAPIMRALGRHDGVSQVLVHSGQHYDANLSDQFFEDLEIPEPDLNLVVGSCSHPTHTGRVLIALEPVLQRQRPDWVFTLGSVDASLAAALAAAHQGIRVAHVEAGLRSRDFRMPEEVNRVLIDRLSDALFTTEPSANENLRAEGIDPARIHYVGNVMIDTLERYRPIASRLRVPDALGLSPGQYVVVTLHRPENVEDPKRLTAVLRALGEITYECELPVVLPLHPRTAKNVRLHDLDEALSDLHTLAPMRYLDFICLMDGAAVVITDSGGVQEETTVFGVPCITLRPNTERPITVSEGTNRVYDGPPDGLADCVREALVEGRQPHRPPLWDGKAAERIARITVEELGPASRPGSRQAGADPEAVADEEERRARLQFVTGS